MSGIVGIYHFDGRPVDVELLSCMTDAIAHRGPDEKGCWMRNGVAFGHRMLYVTAESLEEKQPLLDETGEICLVLDGRVDNRDEVTSMLRAKNVLLRTNTDAEIFLQSYKCWGEAFLSRIVGDFAFAIWDGLKQQLFCARDPMGMKPFYYHTKRAFGNSLDDG